LRIVIITQVLNLRKHGMSAPLAATSQLQGHQATSMAATTSLTPGSAHAASHTGLDSAQLLNGQKAVTIVHNGTPYRLQATKLGKLILTK
jgi:hemin uptake protein HemP